MANFISFMGDLFSFDRKKKKSVAHPSLKFHEKYGTPITLAERDTVAIRQEGFEDGIVVSQKQILMNQPVSIEIVKTAAFKGTMHIGFTSMNPDRISRSNMNTDKIRDWSDRKSVMWMRGLFLHNLRQGSVLSFYYDVNGNVKYTVDGSDQEILFQLPDMSRPLWAVFDIYGDVAGIKFIDVDVKIEEPEFDNLGSEINNNNGRRRSARLQQMDQQVPVFNFPLYSPYINESGNDQVVPESNQVLHVQSPPATPSNSRDPPAQFQTPSSPGIFEMKECIVCMNDTADIAFIKCGHICMCHFCAQDFLRMSDTPNLCPVCRAPIQSLLKTYPL